MYNERKLQIELSIHTAWEKYERHIDHCASAKPTECDIKKYFVDYETSKAEDNLYKLFILLGDKMLFQPQFYLTLGLTEETEPNCQLFSFIP